MLRAFSLNILMTVMLLCWPPATTAAEPRIEPYDGLKAGADAYSRNELRRRDAISRQLYWLDESRVRQGIPPLYGEVVYDDYLRFTGRGAAFSPYSPAWPAGPVEVPYGDQRQFGGRAVVSPYRAAEEGLFPGRAFYHNDHRYLFGEPFYTPTPQSIGQMQIQTSPGHWESHPIYPAPPASASPPVAEPPSPAAPPPAAREF